MEVETTKREAEDFNLAGNCAFKDKEYEKAIRFYNYAIDKSPNEARFFANRSAAYLGMGDRSRALSDAEKVIEMNRTWHKGYSRKASVLLRVKKYKDCIETCKIALSLDPDNEAVLHILSLADKATTAQKSNDFSALEEAEAMSDDGTTIEEGLSRLKAIREQKRLEEFLSGVDQDFKPVIDTQKNRTVSDDDSFLEMTAIKHIERLTGKNAFWKNLNPYRVLMLPDTATDEDIRQRYLKLANMIHPDKCSHPLAREAFEYVMGASEMLKNQQKKEECVRLIKGATKKVIKDQQRLIEKGMNPDALPDEKTAIEEEIMRVFAQNEQRQRKARQYLNLYERRDKERLEQKRQKTVEDIKNHREWMNGMDDRVSTWRKHQEKMKKRQKEINQDNLSGETDHDKRRRVEEKAYYTALGEEYKLNWRWIVYYTMIEDSTKLIFSLLSILVPTGYYFYRKWRRNPVNVNTVWVIGASSGIGKAIAELYATQGKNVILSSRNEDILKDVQMDLIKKTKKDVSCFPILCVDIEKDGSFEHIVNKGLSLFEKIDVVVISSGLGIRSFNDTTTPEVEKRMIQNNYLGPILFAKTILPSMRKQHSGTIVFISSIQGLLSVPGRSSYSAAKHALQGYCDSLRSEEAANGIHILTVSPAYVKTNHSLNAICGDGSRYNQMDANTKKGMDPNRLAEMIAEAVSCRRGNLIVAPLYMKLTVVLQYLFPSVITSIMERKARKERCS